MAPILIMWILSSIYLIIGSLDLDAANGNPEGIVDGLITHHKVRKMCFN